MKVTLPTMLLAAVIGAYALVAGAQDSNSSLLPKHPQASRGEQCVEPTDVIRRNHMKFLLHQRDETMHRGIRTTKHSLKNCISCHASKDDNGKYIPINAEGEFCQSCHAYAAVTLDCFQCHATVPEDEK